MSGFHYAWANLRWAKTRLIWRHAYFFAFRNYPAVGFKIWNLKEPLKNTFRQIWYRMKTLLAHYRPVQEDGAC